MDFIIKAAAIALSVDVIILATCWYAYAVVKPNFPELWKQYVVDYDPEDKHYLTRRIS